MFDFGTLSAFATDPSKWPGAMAPRRPGFLWGRRMGQGIGPRNPMLESEQQNALRGISERMGQLHKGMAFAPDYNTRRDMQDELSALTQARVGIGTWKYVKPGL